MKRVLIAILIVLGISQNQAPCAAALPAAGPAAQAGQLIASNSTNLASAGVVGAQSTAQYLLNAIPRPVLRALAGAILAPAATFGVVICGTVMIIGSLIVLVPPLGAFMCLEEVQRIRKKGIWKYIRDIFKLSDRTKQELMDHALLLGTLGAIFGLCLDEKLVQDPSKP